jgi:hypothetical protein
MARKLFQVVGEADRFYALSLCLIGILGMTDYIL